MINKRDAREEENVSVADFGGGLRGAPSASAVGATLPRPAPLSDLGPALDDPAPSAAISARLERTLAAPLAASPTSSARANGGSQTANPTGDPSKIAPRAEEGVKAEDVLEASDIDGVDIPDSHDDGISQVLALRRTSTDSREESLVIEVIEGYHFIERCAEFLSSYRHLEDAESSMKGLRRAVANWLAAQENLYKYYEYKVQYIVRVNKGRIGAGAKLSDARRSVAETPDQWREDDFEDCTDMLRTLSKTLEKNALWASRATSSDLDPRVAPVAIGAKASDRWTTLALGVRDLIARIHAKYTKLSRTHTQIIVEDDRRTNVH